MANKLLKPKRGRVENLPKLAVEDGSLIFAYDTKSPTSTVLVDVGETRYELSAATAKKADDSNALGGSSLQNIVDKIDNATGDGTAFTGLDTTTNNKVKLTRANGTTVEKTINNVSNASTADYAKVSNKIGTGTVGSSTKPVYINAGTPTAISSIPSTFVAAQQINGVNLDTLRTPGMYWAGGGNTNTNKPIGIDAFGLEVLQSAGGWYTQICYASNNQEKQFVRYYDAGTKVWKDWIEQNRLNTKTQSGYAPAPNAANKVYRTDASGNPGWGTLNDSSIGKLASTVTLGDGNGAMIDQNGATYRQRINIFDNATANDVVFSFQQSTDAGKIYKDLFAINDDGTVIAGTFQGALKGTADYSKNSGALGGSSLKNIVDKINNSTGDGTAFTDLDTTTNNKVKLTRANGSTVEKTINNVSNASTANYAKIAAAGTANYLYRNPASRSTSANLTITGLGGLRTFKATSSMTEGKPPVGNAHIIHLDWDNTSGYDAQIAVQAAKNGHMAVRGMGSSVWGSWNTVLDSANYTNYAAKKNAYNSASISNATITLGRSDGSMGTTLTVNNVAHASTADLAKNSNALGGSSLKNITDKIDNSIAANDAMHYMGTLGAESQSPTITTLPVTARTGDAYKVITAGTYASIAAEVGDLFIYSGAWTLIPSGDDGNVYVGDSKSSKFAAKSNNIVVAVGDQKVASAANVTANAGTISALQSTMTQLKANQGTVTTLSGSKATFSTFVGHLNGTSDAANKLNSRGLINAFASTVFPDQTGLFMSKHYTNKTTGFPTSYGNVLTMYDGGAGQLYIGWNGDNPGSYVRHKRDTSEAWSNWHRFITSADALTSSASAIGSTNNYFTAGATTAYIAAKTASAVGNYLPLTGGTLTGDLTVNTKVTINGRGLQLNREKSLQNGQISWWNPSYVTWINYMSDRTAGAAPTGGTPSTYGSVTSWAQRSLIQNNSGYGWIWESAANATVASSVTPTPIMSLSSKEGNLKIRGSLYTDRIFSNLNTQTHLRGNQGYAIINAEGATNGYVSLIRYKGNNGIFTLNGWNNKIVLGYTNNTTINAGTNSLTKSITLIDENGNASFPGQVSATTVNAYLNGTAKNADTVDGFHAIDSNDLTASATSAKIVLAKNVVSYIDSLGLATTSQLEWIEF